MKKSSVRKSIPKNIPGLLFLLLLLTPGLSFTQGILFEDFEEIGSWFADNGVWEVGIPTVGPQGPYSNEGVAGTVLNGNFPGNANTRLISPGINLPSVTSEKILLKFWHWFRFSDDNGRVQISVNGGGWETISDPIFDGNSTVWTQYILDLTEYAGSNIRIAFFFNSGAFSTDNGWYIDSLSIEKTTPEFCNPTDFELGIRNWYADNGLWEIGIPMAGPDSAHSGQLVAGTVLNSNFAGNANTRLISPEFTLTPNSGQSPTLFFWHWFRFSDDNGRVQISVDGGDWETITSSPFDGNSTNWTQFGIDLTPYIGSNIRIAFFFNSGAFSTDVGWYIDDIRIDGAANTGCSAEICNDGIDNDDDGLTDCEDPDCSPPASASNTGPYQVGQTGQLSASGGSSYEWSGPGGFSSSLQNPTLPNLLLSDDGTYTVTVTDINGCSAVVTTEVEVRNDNPGVEATIVVGENEGPQGSIIEIPIMISNCESLLSAQWTFELVDPNVASFVHMDLAPDLNTTDTVQFNPATGLVSFVSRSAGGLSFTSGDTVFVLSLLLTGTPGDTSLLTLIDSPLAVELGCASNGVPNAVDPIVVPGKVTVLSVIAVTGQVYSWNQAGMEKVEVTLTGADPNGASLDLITTTDQNGNYIFNNIPPGSTFEIACSKNTDFRNGLSTFELYIGVQYLLGLKPALISSPYQVAAGDANCSNSFSVTDILMVQQLLVELIDNFGPDCSSWQFIPDSFTFPAAIFPYSTTANFVAANVDVIADFRGIKKGDLIESADPQKLLDHKLENRSTTSVLLTDRSFESGELFELSFKLDGLSNWSGFQLSLHFDTDYLDFAGVGSISNNPENLLVVGDTDSDQGHLRFSQLQTIAQEQKNLQGPELFRLKFRARRDIASLQNLIQLTDHMEAQVFDPNLDLHAITLKFSKELLSLQEGLKLHPNPAGNITQLEIYAAEPGKIDATLFDALGHLVKQWTLVNQKGHNSCNLVLDDLPAGSYFLKLQRGKYSDVRKLVLIR